MTNLDDDEELNAEDETPLPSLPSHSCTEIAVRPKQHQRMAPSLIHFYFRPKISLIFFYFYHFLKLLSFYFSLLSKK